MVWVIIESFFWGNFITVMYYIQCWVGNYYAALTRDVGSVRKIVNIKIFIYKGPYLVKYFSYITF